MRRTAEVPAEDPRHFLADAARARYGVQRSPDDRERLMKEVTR
ncbi:hypothetical protein ACTU45_07790 [Streptomyces sp. 24-1644]